MTCIFLFLEKSTLRIEHFQSALASLKNGNARESTVLDDIVGEVVTFGTDLVSVVVMPLVDDSVIKSVYTALSTFGYSHPYLIYFRVASCCLMKQFLSCDTVL